MSRRCPSQAAIKDGVLFCSLSFGHRGKHKGYGKEWEDPAVGGTSSPPAKKQEPPKHEGPVWSAICQHCKFKFLIEVRPDQVTRSASVVVCPKCKQSGLYWFEVEPESKFVHGITEKVLAEELPVRQPTADRKSKL